ncbi:hypothetical protein Y032_0015g2881 [Ancylostoma ceylanicum]|uniref:SCP domain-containing protein n=2 Tax=Ancylostoma ceylanicum TaxID=53326 RepID=A0A016V9A8_9BILA|nr:hypothetical protein Y032_0015g2881 [Ancylostoma ceylanicum]
MRGPTPDLKMAQWRIPLTLLYCAAIVISGRTQQNPNCSQLNRYASPNDVRESFNGAILAEVYDCALEGLGGLYLEENSGTGNCDVPTGVTILTYETGANRDLELSVYVEDAIIAWTRHFRYLATRSIFGCNHVLRYGNHKIVCLFN